MPARADAANQWSKACIICVPIYYRSPESIADQLEDFCGGARSIPTRKTRFEAQKDNRSQDSIPPCFYVQPKWIRSGPGPPGILQTVIRAMHSDSWISGSAQPLVLIRPPSKMISECRRVLTGRALFVMLHVFHFSLSHRSYYVF